MTEEKKRAHRILVSRRRSGKTASTFELMACQQLLREVADMRAAADETGAPLHDEAAVHEFTKRRAEELGVELVVEPS